MTIRYAATASLIAAALSGCAAQGPVNNANLQKISLCGAGHRQTLSADLEAKIAEDIRTGGHVSATLSNELKAAFLTDNTIPANDRLTAYQAYLACVEHM
jgi:hypothetical protein